MPVFNIISIPATMRRTYIYRMKETTNLLSRYAVIVFSTIVFIAYFHHISHRKDDKIIAIETLHSLRDDWIRCIRSQLGSYLKDSQKLWDNIGKASDHCEGYTVLGSLGVQQFPNRDEIKYHLMPIKKGGENHTIVTVGVGEDTDSERVLKSSLGSDGIFYGADPEPLNEIAFRPIGKFFPFAISGLTGIASASVLHNGTYQKMDVKHMNLVHFLTQEIQPPVKFFDQLWIDAEGGEFTMFPYFARGGPLDSEGLTICQFNIEIHYPSDEEREKFRLFIEQILNDRRYVFLKTTAIAGQWKMYFINLDNLACGLKYLLVSN